jgi:beta-galactosidase
LLDVGGYNYQWWEYENDHVKFPNRIMMGTESVPKEAFQNWNLVEKHPYIIGDFVWTAMDYLGESGIGHTSCENEKGNQLRPWPWFNGYCGDIDLIGEKKPQSYYRDVVWRRSKN